MNAFLLVLIAAASPIDTLVAAYPDFLASSPGDVLVWKDGTRMPYGPPVPEDTPYEERLNRATLADQMSVPYTCGWPPRIPQLNEDPGRLRYEPFFRKMYGDTKEAANKRLVRVPWLPGGKNSRVMFSSVNGAAKALEAVSKELAASPQAVRRYAAKPVGTFYWREIENTDRLSMHSFGIAIDLQLPPSQHRYWQWDARPEYPRQLIEDENLGAMVKVFEKHGFIWGGKWYHYDSMHFEYRPELALQK